jgi:hypothetical protein
MGMRSKSRSGGEKGNEELWARASQHVGLTHLEGGVMSGYKGSAY